MIVCALLAGVACGPPEDDGPPGPRKIIIVKPGSDPNCINLKSRGVVPVAIFGSDLFDVTNIDLATLSLNGLEVRLRDRRGAMCSVSDSNGDGYPDLNADRYVLEALRNELAAFREGAGKDMDILVDLNWNFKPEGFLKVARTMEPYDLMWVEIDTRDPKALAHIRRHTTIPIASCECLFGRRDYRPYFENASMDVAIIDVPWNGFSESLKIAAMADTYELNVAPHNFYGHLSTMMSAHLSAVVPNLRIMETDPDVVPWHDDLFTVKPVVKDGMLSLPEGPGWGTEINEEAVRAHPPKGDW